MSQGVPQDHPAPHRDRVPTWALLVCLAAGPAAWSTQLILGYGLSSYACFPDGEPFLRSPPPGWSGEQAWLLLLNLVCLALTCAALAFDLRAWRRTRDEKRGGAGWLLEVGEGRSRFLALAGMLACGVFAAAIVFNTINLLAVPACWEVVR